VIPGTTETGGLLYIISTGIWTPFPEATANGANFLGAIVSSPYGPGFGSQFGILRAVGSYETQSSSPYDFGYLYDGAAGPNGNLNGKGANTVHDSSQHIRQPDRIRSEEKILKSHANYNTKPLLDLF
jgi:hypothetical protein